MSWFRKLVGREEGNSGYTEFPPEKAEWCQICQVTDLNLSKAFRVYHLDGRAAPYLQEAQEALESNPDLTIANLERLGKYDPETSLLDNYIEANSHRGYLGVLKGLL